ncbi:scaffold protein for cluster assembly apbc, mrp-like [hydrocarbon metagenome]|uniref:Scaffold protein for cluster assembly apbc, mrp-like n=1 Tax=hydrocarbon metagenome TaxID=938273 RepID=A0A0W8FYA7_9ZZZZ
MTDLMKGDVLDALSKVIDPEDKKDLVSSGKIKDIVINNNNIKIILNVSSPAHHIKSKMEASINETLKKELKEVGSVAIDFQPMVTPIGTTQQKEQILDKVKYTIAVASGKGGVGKSTVAVNLAVALGKLGYKVGLLDADIYGPSIPLMLGINEKPKIYQDTKSAKMLPLENYGIKVMSIGFLLDDNAPVIWRGPMASGAVKQFMTDVKWDELDFLIFDLPPGTGDIQLTLVQTIPLSGSVIVTTPQEVSLIDARKGVKMFERVNVPVFGIVENMSYFIAPDTGKKYDIFGYGGGEKLANESDVNFLGGIPIDARIREGGDKGVPIVFDLPDSEHSKSILAIAENLVKEAEKLGSGGKPKIEISL